MRHQIRSVSELGVLVRATRKVSRVRIDDLAATVQLSKQFMTDLELGKPGVQLGKVLQVLQELGLYVYVDVPESVQEQLRHSSELIERTAKRRRVRASGGPDGAAHASVKPKRKV